MKHCVQTMVHIECLQKQQHLSGLRQMHFLSQLPMMKSITRDIRVNFIISQTDISISTMAMLQEIYIIIMVIILKSQQKPAATHKFLFWFLIYAIHSPIIQAYFTSKILDIKAHRLKKQSCFLHRWVCFIIPRNDLWQIYVMTKNQCYSCKEKMKVVSLHLQQTILRQSSWTT